MGGLRVGVVGLGFGATVHVPAFLSEGWEIPVVWSRRLERAREQADAFVVLSVAGLFKTDDAAEGVRSFVERREPRFTGS